MSHYRLSVAVMVGFFALSGCHSNDSASPKDNLAESSTGISPATAKAIRVEPASLPSCDIREPVTVTWDFRAKHPGVTIIQIWTGDPQSGGKLFAAGGATGKATTGPWTSPGSIFVAIDPKNGDEEGRVTVGGPHCST